MNQNTPSKTITRLITRLDVIVVIFLIILLASFALSGSTFATEAFFFAISFLVGYSVGYIATVPGFPRWLNAFAGFLVSILISILGFTLIAALADIESFGWNQRLHNSIVAFPGGYAYGFLMGILIVVSRNVFPPFTSATQRDIQQQKQRTIRNLMIIGGVSLALILVCIVAFAAIFIIARATAYFLG